MSGDLGVTQGPGTEPETSECVNPLPDPPPIIIIYFSENICALTPWSPSMVLPTCGDPGSVPQELTSLSTT